MVTGVAGESEKSPVEGAIRSYRGARYQGGGYGTRYLITHCQLPDYAVVCEPAVAWSSTRKLAISSLR